MKYKNGEVVVSPKTFYWVEMPTVINENDKIDLLKKDILLVNSKSDTIVLEKLKEKNNEYNCFFYNLDGIFLRNQIKGKDMYSYILILAKFIKSFNSSKSAVHTSIIDKSLSDFFKKEGIPYFEKNMHDKKNAFQMIEILNNLIFEKSGKNRRAFLRLNIHSNEINKIEIYNLTTQSPPIIGYLKDISLNGLGIILPGKKDLALIKLKDILQLKVFMLRSIVKIQMAFVTRMDEKNLEVGVNYKYF